MTDFENVNKLVATYRERMDREIYNQLAEELLPWVTSMARTYSAKVNNIVDADALTSIALCEALNDALSANEYKYEFRAFLKLVMVSKFKNAVKAEMKNMRIANHKTQCDVIFDEDGNETSLIESIPDTTSTENFIEQKFLLKDVMTKISDQEKQLLFVLMDNTGKQRGSAVAKFFSMPEYNSALRVRVNRFLAKLKTMM